MSISNDTQSAGFGLGDPFGLGILQKANLGTTHIMVDLETMGTDPYSPVVAIGAVRFTVGGSVDTIGETFYQPITLASCMELGLKPSASTITWWLTNAGVTDKARALFADPSAVALPLALDAFTDWYNSSEEKLWGNSARFDLGLLSDCYRACNKSVPWLHWNEGCYRTLKSLPDAQPIKLTRGGTHHNALDDAVSQALHMQAIYRALKLS